MKFKLLFLAHIMGFVYNTNGQGTFGLAQPCNVNVYNPVLSNQLRKPVIDATFQYTIDGFNCSGVLINRNTSDVQLGYYFLTARHCVSVDNFEANSPTVNFDINHVLRFNYQSPDANNGSVPTENRGLSEGQSNLFPNSSQTFRNDGNEYFHQTKLRLVNRFFWGDFALVEILTPLPPHFNFTYAGWNANRFFYASPFGQTLPPILPSPYVGVSHPRGDIKKIAGAHNLKWVEIPTATTCYTITTVIDVLFGWLWGNKSSTRVICNYVDIPWVIVRNWDYGATEGGSSGSGLFGPDNRQFGILSGAGGSCEFPAVIAYGKLHANYFNKSIKNTLNPNNDVLVDLLGMPSRKIDCYPSLRLPGPIIPTDPNSILVSGQYFPANHYQTRNDITLRAINDITTEQPINIYSNANYTFRAGKSITLNPNFSTNGLFLAEIRSFNDCYGDSTAGGPDNGGSDSDNSFSDLNHDISLKPNLDIYPNPSSGEITIRYFTSLQSTNSISILNVLGSKSEVLLERTVQDSGEHSIKINLSNKSSGLYLVRLKIDEKEFSRKLTLK